jgi:hypothetical protein
MTPSPFLAPDCRHCTHSLLYRSEHLCSQSLRVPIGTVKTYLDPPVPRAETLAQSVPHLQQVGSAHRCRWPARRDPRQTQPVHVSSSRDNTNGTSRRHRGNGRLRHGCSASSVSVGSAELGRPWRGRGCQRVDMAGARRSGRVLRVTRVTAGQRQCRWSGGRSRQGPLSAKAFASARRRGQAAVIRRWRRRLPRVMRAAAQGSRWRNFLGPALVNSPSSDSAWGQASRSTAVRDRSSRAA